MELHSLSPEIPFLSLGDFIPKTIPYDVLITRSEGMKGVRKEIEKAAASDVNVLIEGDTGTGKELIARIIHSHSKFAEGPFISACIPTVPVTLAEAFFFGHEKGSFTGAVSRRIGFFESAQRGSLFLDEIGDFPYDLQPILLEAVERKEIKRVGSSRPIKLSFRIISATNKDIKLMMAKDFFRNDLYFRLSALTIKLPPLRERLEDLPELCDHILARLKFKHQAKKVIRLEPAAVRAMRDYSWPGNVRELESVLGRAFMSCEGENIRERDIISSIHHQDLNSHDGTHRDKVRMMEKELIEKALQINGYNISRTALEMKMPRSTLHRKINNFRIKIHR